MKNVKSSDEVVSLPLRRIDEHEWLAVPRTVPDRLLRWGSIIPYYALLLLFIFTQRSVFNLEAELGVFLAFVLVLWGLFTFLAVRVAPWTCLLGTVALLYLGQHTQSTFTFTAVVAVWLVGLGLAGSSSSIRFTLMIRSWRLQPNGTELVTRELLNRVSVQRGMGKRLKQAAVSLGILLLIKILLSFFIESEMSISALPATFTVEDLDLLVIPAIAAIFWIAVLFFQWAQEKIAGNVVLEIPVNAQNGPMIFARALNAVVQAEAQRPGCTCGAKARQKTDKSQHLLELDDACPVHGIEAVNSLTGAEFQRLATETWVWGVHAQDLPVRTGERIKIVGLHGWGSKPSVIGTPTPGADQEKPTHSGYRPWRTSEVFKRGNRRIRWSDRDDLGAKWLPMPEEEYPVIDHIRLDSVGLPGVAVRREGTRPRFETSPVSMAHQTR